MVVSRRPNNAEDRVPSQASQLDVVDWDRFLSEYFGFHLSVSFITYHRRYLMLASDRVVKQHTKR